MAPKHDWCGTYWTAEYAGEVDIRAKYGGERPNEPVSVWSEIEVGLDGAEDATSL